MIVELGDELKAYEDNNDALYADQTRKKIKAYEALQLKYRAFSEELSKESEGGHGDR